MEHIIQFGVTIDESEIIKRVKEIAAQKVLEKVQKEIDSYTRGWSSLLDEMFEKEVKRTIDENKDEIIKRSVDNLTKNMTRTKMVKEKMEKLLNEVE